jgi:PAS domain S-box-containing protein
MSDRSDAESAVRRSEARLSGILTIAADAIISIDDQQHIIMFNRGAEEIFGYGAAEVMGQPLDILLPPRFRVAHSEHVRAFGASGVAARRMGDRKHIFGLRKNGQEFPAEASISTLELDGERTYTVVLRDITERKQVERLLERSNQELEDRVAQRTRELKLETERRLEAQAALARAQRMEAFGQLAGGVAHDFNNLLAVISGNQELLEIRLTDSKDIALLKRAQEAAEMGARLTDRLLTFARRRRLERELVNLNELVIGMVELLRRSIGDHVTLSTNLSPRLWMVRADASEIENAVLNLTINARDAMPNGGSLVIETADCTVRHGEIGHEAPLAAGDYVRIAVADTGTGMTREVLSRAFEPFFTTKPPGKGTGLGLSTIYGFVNQSGGTVTVDSEVGAGTRIAIYLPRASERNFTQNSDKSADVPIVGGNEHILLVDDRADVREVTRTRLARLGYTVTEADNGVQAIEHLQSREQRFDLVLSDVVMPGGVSGFDLRRWVRENRPGLKMLLTSGFSSEIDATTDEEPTIAILAKPHSTGELAHAVRSALDS